MKAILEIDMPENCGECVAAHTTEYADEATIYCHCCDEDESECPNIGRRDDCPLKPANQ